MGDDRMRLRDIYGERENVDELAAALLASDWLREVRENAWDEGHAEARARNGWVINLHDCPNNPYR